MAFDSSVCRVKRLSVTAAEKDVVTRWRYLLCYMKRAGVTSGIKRQMRRRERREGRQEAYDSDR